MSSQKRQILITLLSVIGFLISLKLTFIYINANFIVNAQPSFCAINEVLDCDAVAKTEYSLFLGVPLSIYGMMFFAMTLLMNFATRISKHDFFATFNVFKNPNSYIFSLSTIAVVISIVLAWISSNIIHKLCILCYVTYLINFLLLAVSKNGEKTINHFKNSVKDFIDATSTPINSALIVSLAILASLILFNVNQYNIFIPSENIKAQKEFNQYKTNNYKVKGNILGDKDAKVIIHEYTDLQCPYCGVSNSMLHRLVSEYKNIRIIHHNFPLDKECNTIMQHDGHKNSCLLAKYTEAAKYQNKLWDFNSIIFENNKELTIKKALVLAKSAGIDIAKMVQDSKKERIDEKLQKDIEKALELGIVSTPTYRIGIKIYEGIMPYEELKQIVIDAGAIER